MADEDGRREQKKRETRKAISDAATALFTERGFDAVTVAEVAEAAGVAKMTVFNYFPRKEDLFFDREGEPEALVRGALAGRAPGEAPVAALHALARRLEAERHPFAKVTASVALFWRTIAESPALLSRVRELREEIERGVAGLLAQAGGAPAHNPRARVVAATVMAVWIEAYAEALRLHRAGEKSADVRAGFLAILEDGFAMVARAAEGTPYG